MFLGIEIGGTKLQLGVGPGDGSALVALERYDVDPSGGAAGILQLVESAAAGLLEKHPVRHIGVGFGGPVDSAAGRVITSHQIAGWDGLPLAQWCQSTLGVPTVVANDCDAATLAEARFGAGEGKGIVFFVTVGTGVGGGLAIQGRLHGRGRPAVAEIGHLRPGLDCDRPDATVESIASGWGIAAAARARIAGQIGHPPLGTRQRSGSEGDRQLAGNLAGAEPADAQDLADLLARCGGNPESLTAQSVAQAAADGNAVARAVLAQACQALGWAIAQVITLLAPEIVVVGGGVSLIGEPWFFAPLRSEVRRYVFPPLVDACQIVPAQLGQLVVVHGALALAAAAAG